MGKLKQLSGREVVRIFESHGFIIKRTSGSHVRLTLRRPDGDFHVTVPLHVQLKKGILRAKAKDFELCFDKEKAQKYFYTE